MEIADTAVVHPGTIVGEGCRILDYAVVGKQPVLSPRSTAAQEELPPLELGAGAVVLRDIPPRAVVVGNHARQIREVPDGELI